MARPRIMGSLVTGWLEQRHRATARDVAHGLRMPVHVASWHLHRLRTIGEVVVVDRVRVEHADRPVAVYALAQRRSSPILRDDWLRA